MVNRRNRDLTVGNLFGLKYIIGCFDLQLKFRMAFGDRINFCEIVIYGIITPFEGATAHFRVYLELTFLSTVFC